MHEYNICYSLDSQYAEQLAVSLASILKNADTRDKFNIYILDGGLSEADKVKINLLQSIKEFNIDYIKINPEDYSIYPMLKDYNAQYKDYHVTVPTYFRFKLPSFLPEIDKILYFDCDVIVRTSLHDLYNEDLDGYAAAMISDVESNKNAERLGIKKYYNAGVMLINLDFWRENNLENQVLEFVKNNKDKILWQDQDIINCVLSDFIKCVETKWNFQYFAYDNIEAGKVSDADILHLSGRFKPWLIPFEHPLYDVYYYYLSFTAWKYKISEYKLNGKNKILKENVGGNETNILKYATDADIQVLYKDINEIYGFTNESLTYLKKRFDEEIPKVYTYVNETLEEKLNECFPKLYDYVGQRFSEEIPQIYTYVNETLEEKLKKCFPLLYDYVNEAIEKKNKEINLIYDEISKNYKYTEKLIEDLRTELKDNKKNREE